MLTFKQLGKFGRLGNQLFQIASTIGIAQKMDVCTEFPEVDLPFTHRTWPISDIEWTVVNIPWGYHELNLDKKTNYSLHGYLQSEKYFLHIKDQIREFFTFKEEIVCKEDFISVHIRRGDYTPEYYTLLGSNYYYKALATLPDLPIYVFTDDPKAAKEIIPTYEQLFYSDPFYDLNLMTKAKYAIIANSSFSWWGAWLSDAEKVIAPKNWFGPKSPFDTKDLIPDHWIKT
jgi:hypothetical protein